MQPSVNFRFNISQNLTIISFFGISSIVLIRGYIFLNLMYNIFDLFLVKRLHIF